MLESSVVVVSVTHLKAHATKLCLQAVCEVALTTPGCPTVTTVEPRHNGGVCGCTRARPTSSAMMYA